MAVIGNFAIQCRLLHPQNHKGNPVKPQAKSLLLAALLATAAAAHAETRAVIETGEGNIELRLDEKKAPKTVANFVKYAKKGFYNGTIFHRVIDGFMIQGGGFTPDMLQKDTDAPIPNEADNGLKNETGTIAMARTAEPHSASSQFFINVADNTPLDYTAQTPEGWGYAVFGRVSGGMDVVEHIAKTRTGFKAGHQDVPLKPVEIKRVRILK